MSNFLNRKEIEISEEFKKKGYIIKDAPDISSLEQVRSHVVNLIEENKSSKNSDKNEKLLNFIHKKVKISELNSLRLKIINNLNKIKDFRKAYFSIFQPYLEILVGNELAMQLRVNLSIQIPKDDSSLLPTHSDVWSGDSPFEIVAWLPLVNCFKSKSMYLLPPKKSKNLYDNFSEMAGKNSKDLFKIIKKDVEWLEVKYGQILLFNQTLPHGNIVNEEKETRWSMNCRFKGLFTPYKDKKIGEFFEPITTRAASQIGMNFKTPKIK